MTMTKYQEMMMNELEAGNMEAFNKMQKCLRDNNYDVAKAFGAYVKLSHETASDEFV